MKSKPRALIRLTLTLLALTLPGCLEIDTRIQLNPDGSATVTEKLCFSQQLLDLASKEKGDLQIADLLKRPAVEERLKLLSKKMRLVSHEVHDRDKGARESVAVYQVDDINDLLYASPFLAYLDFADNNIMRCKFEPLLKSRGFVGGHAGEMVIAFRPVKSPKSEVRPPSGTPVPKGPSPRALQAVRQVQPIFADLLKGFKLRLTFASYAPIRMTGFGLRDQRAGTTQVDLINVADKDLDRFGSAVLDNEEILVDLLRGRLGSENIVDTAKHFQDNPTVPLFLPWGSAAAWWHGHDEICFRPSRELFDRHFAGQTLDFSPWQKLTKPARFEEIGWVPKKSTNEKEPK